jgi:hypothetical protein
MERQEVARLPLSELKAREARIAQLTEELRANLSKGPGELSPEEISKSYELYAQLRKIAWYDARFQGLAQRFWEVWQNRQASDRAEQLGKNLKALEQAQRVLQTASLATLPLFAQVGINDGSLSPRLLEWARWQMLDGFRQSPELCPAGGFGWSAVPGAPFSPETRAAAHYLRYAYGDPYQQVLGAMCTRVRGIR